MALGSRAWTLRYRLDSKIVDAHRAYDSHIGVCRMRVSLKIFGRATSWYLHDIKTLHYNDANVHGVNRLISAVAVI